MRVLITGGFGNVGMSVVRELLAQGHEVVVFELDTKKNQKISKKFKDKITVIWGDLLNGESLALALVNIDVVIHLAAIIPPLSEENEALCFKVNVRGTETLLSRINALSKKPGLVFTSSVSVMGPTQSRPPPISPYDPPNPTTNYTRSKVDAERIIATSGVRYCICRLGAVLSSQASLNPSLIKEAFNINLAGRVEIVLDLDVATALRRAAELMVEGDAVLGKVLNIGGGKEKGFQRYGRDLTNGLFEKMGIGAIDERCFTKADYFIDWMDTTESQALLSFQNHSYDEAISAYMKQMKLLRPFIRLFAPLIRRRLERQSPWFSSSN
ncbi:MAG: NAD-dependent epimerase/dehydratase family protein [Candidatus Sigynarchaeota archaeon]